MLGLGLLLLLTIGFSEDSLIRNVTLIDREGEKEDIVVNLLLRDGRLELVTQDEIPADSVELAVDAGGGVLLGHLNVGEPATFVILDADPREDFEVLLDTQTHARFAIRRGEVVRNTLPMITDPSTDGDAKRSGWLAYTPPPMSLPSEYRNTSKWNRYETKYISGIFLGALALDRQDWLSQDSASNAQVGDLDSFAGGEIRAMRLGAIGTLNFPKPWVYTVFAATNAFDKGFNTETTDNFSLYDWRLDIPTPQLTTLSIGKQKEPISMERNMSLVQLPLQERAAVLDAFLPARNVGLVLSGGGFEKRMTWAGGIFNDWIDTGSSYDNSAIQYIGRFTCLPFVTEDEGNLVHVGFGLRYSDAEEGQRFATEPEFNQSPLFVDTGLFDANNSLTYNFEASWRRGPFWLASEYLIADIDAPSVGSPRFSGFSVTGSWALTGEMRGYDRQGGVFTPLPVAKHVDQNGWGAWEIATRWSELDATDGLVSGGDMRNLSLGLNWWLTPLMSLSFNYRWTSFDQSGLDGESTGLLTRLTLFLE